MSGVLIVGYLLPTEKSSSNSVELLLINSPIVKVVELVMTLPACAVDELVQVSYRVLLRYRVCVIRLEQLLLQRLPILLLIPFQSFDSLGNSVRAILPNNGAFLGT